jgi:hypothetical protein
MTNKLRNFDPESNDQPVAVIQQLADGLASSIGATLGPGIKIEPDFLGLLLTIGDRELGYKLGFPWDMGTPLSINIERNTEIALRSIQAELAETTSEPWPARSGKQVADHGLPQPEPKLVDNLLELRFRYGSDVIELEPIEIAIGLDDLIERASASWLATTAAGEDPEGWVSHLQLDWIGTGQWKSMWRYILRLCEKVDPENREAIELIGADPLTSLMYEFPDQTLRAIEDVADRQPTVIDALSIVMGDSEEVDSRIDAILARYGRSRQ